MSANTQTRWPPTRWPLALEQALATAQRHQQAGETDQAAQQYRQILQRWPRIAAAHNGLGLIEHAAGHNDAALAHFERALQQEAENPAYHNNRGLCLRGLKRLTDAEAACRQALSYRANYPEAWNNLGAVYLDQSQWALARSAFREALRHRRAYAKAWVNLARAEWGLEQWEAARRAARHALRSGDNPSAFLLLANAEVKRRRYPEALVTVEQALRLTPEAPEVVALKASILRDLWRYDEALALQHIRVTQQPTDVDAWNELGLTLGNLNRLVEAEHAFNQSITNLVPASTDPSASITLPPESMRKLHQCRFNRALNLLKQGDFAQGWAEYASRWNCREHDLRQCFPMPVWQGESLAGRHLIVATEQGLGDTLQFARYLHDLRERYAPARLTLAASTALAPLFTHFPGIDRLLLDNEPVPNADYFCMLMDLPRHFQTRLATIPATTPYFTVDPIKAEYWRTRVHQAAGQRRAIGLAWQGNPEYPGDHHRSFPLAVLEPLFALPGICWIKLQKGFGSEQLAATGFPIVDLAELDDARDLMDTAAIIQALDLVILSDSMLAHLAGALAQPTWLLLSSAGDWRWLTEREDSPWYPSMRLFRQHRPGDWEGVAHQVAKALSLHSER